LSASARSDGDAAGNMAAASAPAAMHEAIDVLVVI
jgi:hypothetical protein